jgi:hypothetical protein
MFRSKCLQAVSSGSVSRFTCWRSSKGLSHFILIFQSALENILLRSKCCDVFFHFQNLEAEKQVRFFQGSVAAAFSERDKSVMEV